MKNRLNALVILFFILCLGVSCASPISPVQSIENINKPEELNAACKKKSIEYFKEKNKKPHGWTSMWRVEKNTIDVKGEWKVNNISYTVMCRIKQGLNETMMVISIEEKKVIK